ncbi:ribonuclease R [Paucibacter sp. APW11]|uniref:Ribonuclease R n=1 Tax=Roseateles aquae TaxID=3077235 RepID=A0ABU3P7F6_9BURK|nr:ribonuclease R [Paucibacter sp. APW11]MDT8998506.1 ribonuclease R [Paucibacter sp. APW11]
MLSEVEGTVQGHRDGHGFLIPDEGQGDVYLSAQEMHSVMHGDRLRVRVVRFDKRGRPEGRVLEILERKKRPIIGRLLLESGIWLVAPEDKRFGQDILIPKNGIANATAGQVVAVELTEPPSLYSQPVGRVTEVLGEIDDPGMEIEIAVRKYDVPHAFSTDALAQAAKLPERLRAVDLKQRIDLRDVPLVTIDGEDARDFDDAVYCQPHKQGRGKNAFSGWRLLVAIADVSHYVKPGEALDLDAYERATSVYFPRRVIPMLPEKLSNGLCSLNPDVDRLSMVCDMLIDEDGQTQAYQFYPAVICSHARLTYTEVAAVLANTHGPEAAKRRDLVPHLLHLHEVYRALLANRQKRGAIDFETTETQIICDDNGRIEKIVPRTRNEAHRLIEEAMLAANVCAADFIAGNKHHALFRVHEGPTPEKRTALQAYLRALGLGLGLSDDPSPGEYQAIAHATKDRPDATQIHSMLLRSMQQAIYTSANSGHFGLAYSAYTHFTSPIRRYPDLLVHRVIKAMLGNKRYQLDASKMNVPVPPKRPGKGKPINPATASTELERWEVAGAHCSANERRADEASRDVEAWLKCRYMREHLGEEFAGTVSAVTSFGLFVQLDALYVEGLIHITELGGEYYRFDEVRQELRGERTGIRYATGARVQIQVSRVDLDGRKIDFRLVRDSDEARLVARAQRDKHGQQSRADSASKAAKAAKAAVKAVASPADEESAVAPTEALELLQRADRALKAERKQSRPSKASKAAKAGRARSKTVGAAAHPVKAARQAARQAAPAAEGARTRKRR